MIEYRKKWEKNLPEIKYCSDECRRNKNNPSTHYGEGAFGGLSVEHEEIININNNIFINEKLAKHKDRFCLKPRLN
jgi:hypothetical protein